MSVVSIWEGAGMVWARGRGLLGVLKPLLGDWITIHGEGESGAAAMQCRRLFTPFGKGWIELDANWRTGPSSAYRERAFFGSGEDGGLCCFSFTSDGKSSIGRLSDGHDVDPAAIAFEAQMKAGLARMIVNRRGNGDRDRHIKGDHPGVVVLGDVGGGRSPEPTSPRTTSSLAPAATVLSFGS